MSNLITDLVSKSAQKELDNLYKSLSKTHEEILKISNLKIDLFGGATPKSPAELKRIITEFEKVGQASDKVNAKLTENAQKEQALLEKKANRLSQTNTEEIVNQRILTTNANRQATATSTLAGAYRNLSAQVSIASEKYQNLIVRGKTSEQTQKQFNAELRRAKDDFQSLQVKILSADKAVDKWSRTGERSIGFLKNLASAFGLVGGLTLFASVSKEIFNTTKELQSLDNALKQVSSTQEKMATNQSFLREVSEAYGLEINGLTKQFTQFYVSAKDKISGTEIENIFRSVSKAGATMGLSVENQERAFLALNQMMSKGTIQAEELRGQLGEALPGAFGIMAKALGVNEKELSKLMKDGKLLAGEVLPKFARELENVYGIETIERVETLTASQNRLTNTWTEFVRSINESKTGGISFFFNFIIKGLSDVVNLLIRANTSWETLNNQAAKKGSVAGKKFFEENLKINSSNLDLSEKERASINKRINDIKYLLKNGYNDPSLQKEINELYRKLNPSEGQSKSLGKLAETKINSFENKIQNLKKELKEIEGQSVKNAFKNIIGLGSGERTIKKAIEQAEFDLAYWKQVSQSSDDFGKEITPDLKNPKNTEKNKKAQKSPKQKIELDFDYLKSELEREKAQIEKKKAIASEQMNNEKISFQERIKAREDFSKISIELIDKEFVSENELNKQKYNSDIEKNNLALRNKEISFNKHKENIDSINRDFSAKLDKSVIDASNRQRLLNNEDLDFFEKIQNQKDAFLKKTSDLIFLSEKDKNKTIADNEKLTTEIRENAFQDFLRLSKAELEINEKLALSKVPKGNQEERDSILQFYKNAGEELDKIAQKSPLILKTEELKKQVQDFYKSMSSGFLGANGFGSLSIFTDLDVDSKSTFQNLLENAESFKEKFSVIMGAVGNVAKDIYAEISNASNQNFQDENARLDQQYKLALSFAGESAEGKKEIESRYQEKQKEIKNREAKANKDMALFNVSINTAQGIVGALASAPPNIPLSIAVGVIGALQASFISARKVPQYFKGTENHKGGLMLINDGKESNYKETVITPDGKIMQPTERNVVMNAPVGTKVFTEKQWESEMLKMINIKFYNKNLTQKKENLNDYGANKIIQAINGKSEIHQTFDKSGFNYYVKNGSQISINENNRFEFNNTIV